LMNLKESLKSPLFSLTNLYLFISTGGFVGFLPPFPGTLGALQGIILYYLTMNLSPILKLLIALILVVLGIISSGNISRTYQKKDPDEVIIDEIAGAYLASLGKTTLLELTLVFILFRIIDISKPFPLKRLEKLKGGLGIMMDDVVAGLLTNLLVILFFWLFYEIT